MRLAEKCARVVLLAVTACAGPQASAPVVAPAVAVVAAPVEPPAPAPAPASEAAVMCAGNDAEPPEMVRVRVENATLECPEGRLDRCHGESIYTVANCSDEVVELRSLRFLATADARRVMVVEPHEPHIAPGATWTWKTKVFRELSERLLVDVVDAAGVQIWVAEQPVRVSNPTRDAAMAACVACDGVWGISGLVYRDACNCRARDAGQACRDGDECEGACVFERWDITTPAEPVRCQGKRCTARLAGIGRPLGKCSERVVIRSCHTLVRDGIAGEPDQAVPWGISRVCID